MYRCNKLGTTKYVESYTIMKNSILEKQYVYIRKFISYGVVKDTAKVWKRGSYVKKLEERRNITNNDMRVAVSTIGIMMQKRVLRLNE